ncbi:voltage-gated potassium channel [Venturia nashicola]|nr:voltage-gated potassium channel [Venturia nashicola]
MVHSLPKRKSTTITMLIKNVVDAAGNPYVLNHENFSKSILGHTGWKKDKQEVEKDLIAGRLISHTIRTWHDQAGHPRSPQLYTKRRASPLRVRVLGEILYLMGALEPNTAWNQQGTRGGQCVGSISLTSTSSSMDEWKNPKGMADWLHGKNPLNATETLTGWLLVFDA